MECNKKTGSPVKWEYCPVELLCLIFRKLDTDSLVMCMYVCRSWNSVALYTAEKKKLWEYIVKNFLIDKGQMAKMKSLDMSLQDLFINSVLWSHCDKAELMVLNTYKMSAYNINHVHVYKDNLIIVTSISVKYFDLTKSEFKRDIAMGCIDFLENDKIILVEKPSTEDFHCKPLHLYGKINVDDFNISESNEKIIENVLAYRLVKEGCYVFDNMGKLVLYKPEESKGDWNIEFIARHYSWNIGSCHIHIFRDKPYIILNWGQIYFPNNQGGFSRVLHREFNEKALNCGSYFKIFHNFSIIYEVEAVEIFSFFHRLNGCYRKVIIQCPKLTCVTEHGEILFLGYSDGKIEFLMPREMNETAIRKRQYKVTEASDLNSLDNCIISIDVYEEREQHHVFVATKPQVYHLLLKHTNMNDYLWSVFPRQCLGVTSITSDFRYKNVHLISLL